MSVIALHLFEQLTEAADDRARAKIIAEAVGQLEDDYTFPPDAATAPQVRESELRLQREIEGVRLEIKEVELKLQREIRAIEVKIAESRADLIRWVGSILLIQATLIAAVLLKIAHLI